jgi:hypothetical protein
MGGMNTYMGSGVGAHNIFKSNMVDPLLNYKMKLNKDYNEH